MTSSAGFHDRLELGFGSNCDAIACHSSLICCFSGFTSPVMLMRESRPRRWLQKRHLFYIACFVCHNFMLVFFRPFCMDTPQEITWPDTACCVVGSFCNALRCTKGARRAVNNTECCSLSQPHGLDHHTQSRPYGARSRVLSGAVMIGKEEPRWTDCELHV